MLALDTFTGISGLARGLQSFVIPVLYCDYDKYCQSVLTQRMEEGKIHKAPIHSDIKTLHLSPTMKVKICLSSFPCQDVSSAGRLDGIVDGVESSLFFEVMRIVDESPSITTIYFENVSNLIRVGMKDVIDELLKRNFNIHWTIRSADEFGSCHRRARWWCLCSRFESMHEEDEIDELLTINLDAEIEPLPKWDKEPSPRFTFRPLKDDKTHKKQTRAKTNAADDINTKDQGNQDNIDQINNSVQQPVSKIIDDPDNVFDPNWIHRSHCLGNSVVPCVVRAAFIELCTIYRNSAALVESLASYSSPVSSLSYPYPAAGFIRGGRFYPLPQALPIVKPANLDIAVQLGDKMITMQSYPTLRRGITHPSVTLTERGLHDLPTLLVHSTVAKEQMRAQGWEPGERGVIPNINYLEWMMGYEFGWTKVTTGESESLYKSKTKASTLTCNDADVNDDVEGYAIENDQDDQNDVTTDAKQTATSTTPIKPKRKMVKNLAGAARSGMQLMIKERAFPGKGVADAATHWKSLKADTKADYTKRAKQAQQDFALSAERDIANAAKELLQSSGSVEAVDVSVNAQT